MAKLPYIEVGTGDMWCFLHIGIERVLQCNQSGRDWLQKRGEVRKTEIPSSTLFNALNGKRRAEMTEEVFNGATQYLSRTLSEHNVDYLEPFSELNQWDVYAVDGHNIEHACHAEKIERGQTALYPESKSIYMLNLRNGLAEPLCNICGANGKLHAHEMPPFRENIRQRPVKVPTVIIGDPAYHDKWYWTENARQSEHKKAGIYFISKVKHSHKFMMRQPQPFDPEDPVNTGVVEFSMVFLHNTAWPMYLVGYRDPEDGSYYEFFTTVENFRPGVIAWLYFLRWRIEKTYDTFKNGFQEDKDWATSTHAQCIRNALLVLAYNLLHTMQLLLDTDFGIQDKKVTEKYEKELEKREKKARSAGFFLNPLLKLPRMSQMSRQFIRTIRNYLYAEQSIYSLIPAFSAALKSYL